MCHVWIFGYGSLIWRPGFDYEYSMVGHIEGFQRVFYQGNDKHRGSPERLGRVATLLESKESQVWGRAFSVRLGSSSHSQCPLEYLNTRESQEGGYATLTTMFYPRDPYHEPVTAIVYVALPTNCLYLGPKPYPDMAKEIVSSRGDCGPNTEYVLNIAEFMREEVGNVDDEHLFMLEMHILSELEGQTDEDASFTAAFKATEEQYCSGLAHVPKSEKASLSKCDEDFASTVLARKLRCVDI